MAPTYLALEGLSQYTQLLSRLWIAREHVIHLLHVYVTQCPEANIILAGLHILLSDHALPCLPGKTGAFVVLVLEVYLHLAT